VLASSGVAERAVGDADRYHDGDGEYRRRAPGSDTGPDDEPRPASAAHRARSGGESPPSLWVPAGRGSGSITIAIEPAVGTSERAVATGRGVAKNGNREPRTAWPSRV